jgi:hypothetical protein
VCVCEISEILSLAMQGEIESETDKMEEMEEFEAENSPGRMGSLLGLFLRSEDLIGVGSVIRHNNPKRKKKKI